MTVRPDTGPEPTGPSMPAWLLVGNGLAVLGTVLVAAACHLGGRTGPELLVLHVSLVLIVGMTVFMEVAVLRALDRAGVSAFWTGAVMAVSALCRATALAFEILLLVRAPGVVG